MKTIFKVTKPGEIEFTMTITMTLKEWNELAEEVSDRWPGSIFKDKIWLMTREANVQFDGEEKEA